MSDDGDHGNVRMDSISSEDDFIDTLFYNCDAEANGSVPANKLIEYLQLTVENTDESQQNLETLSALLDPGRQGIEVDLTTYRKAMTKWIENIRTDRESTSDNTSSPVKHLSPRSSNSRGFCESIQGISFHGYGNQNVTENYENDYDTNELLSRISLLECHNNKLYEDYMKFQIQLDASDDALLHAQKEKEECKKKIKCLQEIINFQKDVQKENEELKSIVSTLKKEERELKTKLSNLEQEHLSKQAKVFQFEKKFQEISTSLEDVKLVHKNLQAFSNEQKKWLSDAKKHEEIYEAQIIELHQQLRNAKAHLTELTTSEAMITQENSDLQMQLRELQHELASIQNNTDISTRSLLGALNFVDDDDNDNCVCDPLIYCTSPVNSLKIEIGRTADDESPSPFCEKEQLMHPFFELDALISAILVPPKNDFLSSTVQFAIEMKEKQNLIVEHIDIMHSEKDNDGHSRSTENFKMKIKEDLNDFNDWVSLLVKSKEQLEIRYEKLTDLVTLLKEEYHKMKVIHLDSFNMSRTGGDSHLREVEVNVSSSKKEDGAMCIQSIGTQLNSNKKEQCVSEKNFKDMSKSFESIVKEKERLDDAFQASRKSYVELTEKCNKSELKVIDLQQELHKANESASREKLKSSELEESLASTKLAQQLDLKDIWRLVQKEVEKECLEEQKESPLSSSTELLKDEICKEIDCLRTQLHKKQAVFAALSKPSGVLQWHHRIKPSCSCQTTPPPSPLVDALTIDLFESGSSSRRNSKTVDNFLVLGRTDCCNREHTVSCPALDQKSQLVASATQTDNLTCLSHGHLNSSNSSSTSGVLDLDVSSSSSRSQDGRNKQKEFIRSSHRFESDSQTSQSMESNTDTDVSLPHQQSPSLKTAIERTAVRRQDGIEETVLTIRRNRSFTAAIESHSNNADSMHCPRNRSLSFQAAIEGGQRSPMETYDIDFISTSADTTPENPNFPEGFSLEPHKLVVQTSSKQDSRTVNFQLHRDSSVVEDTDFHLPNNTHTGSEHIHSEYGLLHGSLLKNNNWKYHSSLPSDRDFNASFGTSQTYVEDNRHSPKPARKLSTLVEEEDNTDGEIDVQMTDQRNILSGNSSGMYHGNQHIGHVEGDYAWNNQWESVNEQFKKTHTQQYSTGSSQISQNIKSCPFISSSSLGLKRLVQTESPKKQVTPKLSSGGQKSAAVAETYTKDTEPTKLSKDRGQQPAAVETYTKDTEPTKLAKDTTLLESSIKQAPQKPATEQNTKENANKKQHGSITTEKIKQNLADEPHSITVEDTSNNALAALDNVSQLTKLRENNLARKREQMKHMKMPELTEMAETTSDSQEQDLASSITKELTPGVIQPPPPNQNPFLPSVPDEFLKELSLSVDQEIDFSTDQLTDTEIENKFQSLSLAFKTDKLTLGKRLDIQERSRDIAEQNIDKELQGLRDSVENLNHLCTNSQGRDILTRIQQHIEALEQSAARVSCKAEVYGAVQQENRMSRAIEVMIHHVENLRRLREREHGELEEAKKILHDSNKMYGHSAFDDMVDPRRAASIFGSPTPKQVRVKATTATGIASAAAAKLLETSKRRASVATICKSSLSGQSMETSFLMECKQTGVKKGPSQLADSEGPTSRFSTLPSSTSITSRRGPLATNILRRTSSADKGSIPSKGAWRGTSFDSEKDLNLDSSVGEETSSNAAKISLEESAFQRGYEEGIKAKVNQELTREQKRLEDENYDKNEEEKQDSSLTVLTLKEKLLQRWSEWENQKKSFRFSVATIFIAFAICSFILTLVPFGSPTLDFRKSYRHHGKPPS